MPASAPQLRASPVTVYTLDAGDTVLGDLFEKPLDDRGWRIVGGCANSPVWQGRGAVEHIALGVSVAIVTGAGGGLGRAYALDLARRNRKPVIMMKVGASALGGAAAKSHTASIAGDDAVTQAVLDEL